MTDMRIRDLGSRELQRLARLERKRGDWMDLFGEAPPDELLSPYTLCEEGQVRSGKLQQKYVNRKRNIERCWNRVQLYFPELVASEPQQVFEMSTAHGGMLEVLRHLGHSVLGNDFANMIYRRKGQPLAQLRAVNDKTFSRVEDDHGIAIPEEGEDAPDWPYRYIIESVDLPMSIFDAGKVPYPLADKSQDVVMCFQAIEHYCKPEDWMTIVDEFCRISRKTVFVMLNRLIPALERKDGYKHAFDQFRREMRDYDRNGFRCVSTHIHFGSVLGFKLCAR